MSLTPVLVATSFTVTSYAYCLVSSVCRGRYSLRVFKLLFEMFVEVGLLGLCSRRICF